MKTFTVVEVQDVVVRRVYTWTVKAENAEDAIDRVNVGEGELSPDAPDQIGDDDYGPNEFAAIGEVEGDDKESAKERAERRLNGEYADEAH